MGHRNSAVALMHNHSEKLCSSRLCLKVVYFRTSHPQRTFGEHDQKSSWSISATAHQRAKPFWLYTVAGN